MVMKLSELFQNDEDIDILMKSRTIKDILTDKIATIGENMSVRRFTRFESTGLVESYVHGDGKIGVLVDCPKGTEEVAKDVLKELIENSDDELELIRYNHLLQEIQMNEYFDMQAEEFEKNYEYESGE